MKNGIILEIILNLNPEPYFDHLKLHVGKLLAEKIKINCQNNLRIIYKNTGQIERQILVELQKNLLYETKYTLFNDIYIHLLYHLC